MAWRSRLACRIATIFALIVSVEPSRAAPPAAGVPASPVGVYAGTIGDARITLELGTHDDFLIDGSVADRVTSPRPVTGTYFYDRVGIGIYLGGSIASDGRIELHEIRSKNNNESDARAGAKHWMLRPAANGFAGVWTRRKTMLSISLLRIAPFERAGRYDRDARAYRAKLRERTLVYGSTITRGKTLSYRTATDPRYDLTTIQLLHSPDAAIRDRANRALAGDLDARADEAYDCLTNLAYAIGDFGPRVGLKTQISFVSTNAVSLDTRGEVACAYAHPNYEVRPVTVDLRDGSEVDWHAAILAPLRLAAVYRERVKAVSNECSGPRDASIYEGLKADDFFFELRPEGLDLYPELPYAVAVCARDVVIPSAIARTLLTSKYRALLP